MAGVGDSSASVPEHLFGGTALSAQFADIHVCAVPRRHLATQMYSSMLPT